MTGVVARHDGRIEDLLERMPPGLAVLQLDQVQDFVLAIEQQVVETQEYAGAVARGHRRPDRVDPACRAHGGFDVGIVGRRYAPHLSSGEGREYRDLLPHPT